MFMRFFSELKRAGNFIPMVGDTDSLADGRTPVLLRWDYLAASDRTRLNGPAGIVVVYPRTGIVASRKHCDLADVIGLADAFAFHHARIDGVDATAVRTGRRRLHDGVRRDLGARMAG